MRRHFQAVPAPTSTKSADADSCEPSDGHEADFFAGRRPAELLSHVQPSVGGISVQQFEREDETLIVYIDIGDIVAFVYTGQPTELGCRTGDCREPIVVDLHRRNDAGMQRLQILLDGAPLACSRST